MFAPYRVAAIPEPEVTGEADAYEALLRLRARNARPLAVAALTAVGLALAAFGFAAKHAPHRSLEASAALRRAQLAEEAARAIASERASMTREQATFASTLLAAIDGGVKATTDGCTVELPSYAKPSALGDVHGDPAFPLLVVAQGDRELPSPSVARFLRGTNARESYFRSRSPFALTTLPDFRGLKRDVVVVTTTMKHPMRTSPTTFEPGEITGRAYLYDFAQHRVVCMGDVHATSSKEIAYSYLPTTTSAAMDRGPRLTESLDADLDRQLRGSIAGSLFRVD